MRNEFIKKNVSYVFRNFPGIAYFYCIVFFFLKRHCHIGVDVRRFNCIHYQVIQYIESKKFISIHVKRSISIFKVTDHRNESNILSIYEPFILHYNFLDDIKSINGYWLKFKLSILNFIKRQIKINQADHPGSGHLPLFKQLPALWRQVTVIKQQVRHIYPINQCAPDIVMYYMIHFLFGVQFFLNHGELA